MQHSHFWTKYFIEFLWNSSKMRVLLNSFDLFLLEWGLYRTLALYNQFLTCLILIFAGRSTGCMSRVELSNKYSTDLQGTEIHKSYEYHMHITWESQVHHMYITCQLHVHTCTLSIHVHHMHTICVYHAVWFWHWLMGVQRCHTMRQKSTGNINIRVLL